MLSCTLDPLLCLCLVQSEVIQVQGQRVSQGYRMGNDRKREEIKGKGEGTYVKDQVEGLFT